MANLFKGAKQMASICPSRAASMQALSTCSTDAPPGASACPTVTWSGRTVSMASHAGWRVSARPRTATMLSTACVGTCTPATRWPSRHSQASPTSTMLARSHASGRASRRAISSAPMPAGSPRVRAITGFCCVSISGHSTEMLFFLMMLA
ncbi:hypothetical protein D3C71_1462810 [compost metagenome]